MTAPLPPTPLPPTPKRALRGQVRLIGLVLAAVLVTVLAPTTGREVLVGSRGSSAGRVEGPGAPLADPETGRPIDVAAGGPSGTVPSGGPPPAAGASTCPDRAQQIPRDPYSPPCIRWSGDNGGATVKGVTADTITIAWRLPDDAAAAAAAQALVGSQLKIGDSRDDVIRTLEALTDYVNLHFQMYGRKIRLEIFNGLGSNTNEQSGAGQDLANADAVQAATKIEAFADASVETAVYTDALARRGVMALGIGAVSDEWWADRHPNAWGVLGCTQMMREVAEYANLRLFGRPATDAGGDLAGRPRKIALVVPENPYYQACTTRLVEELKASGNALDELITYALDINTLSQDTSSMIAKLSQEQITSVILFTDPVSPLFLTSKASQQKYFPEWIVTGLALTDDDRIAQLYDQQQWEHAFGIRTLTAGVPLVQSVPYAAFKSVRPNEEPAGIGALQGAFVRLYTLAAAIQMAGPHLTPETFAAGWQAYPGGTGFAGTWRGQQGSHGLQVDFEEAYWDPDRTSGTNGRTGAYVTTSPRLELGQMQAGPPKVGP